MNFRITHRTRYEYAHTVSLCQNIARLFPVSDATQQCERTQFMTDPPVNGYREHIDYFGNRVCYFDIQQAHDEMIITTVSDVLRVANQPPSSEGAPGWEEARARLLESTEPHALELRQYILPSPLIPVLEEVAAYAEPHFPPGRPLLDCIVSLMGGIYSDFTYDPEFTDISTPLNEVLEHRRGVCQDYAHLGIACMRAMGFPANYVSGYLETLPPPGEEKLQGADASHAWFGVWIQGAGWVDFDPTNNLLPAQQHLTLARGRDYADVAPLQGVLVGGGEHEIEVAVDVKRLDPS